LPKTLFVEEYERRQGRLSRPVTRRGDDAIVATDGLQGLTTARAELPDVGRLVGTIDALLEAVAA